ncbi:MAG: DNA polymerase III subunit gamma/tau [Bacteroidaceae bacterium]|nr:DNA polymerase III subunit gamma/tau [Bacteroidaceae bacterium]
MEEYIVSARKYRPTTFNSVVGQGALTTTLKNAIHTGKLAHAYLFCGPRGVGKTTCARIFAKTINCLNPKPNGDACEECESCKAFNEQRSFNIHELDAASNNSVDDIRSLIEEVRIPPQVGKYKVFIIDEVHMLSASAFNAFLKTLEEPPRHAIFILATTEKHKILPTILSRCQIYDFNRMSVSDIVQHLEDIARKENVEAEPEALNVIAQKADGGMRDALSIFDQVVSFTAGHLTYDKVIQNLNVLDYEYYFKVVDGFLENKVSELMLLFNDILNKGFQGDHFITGLAKHLRDLMVSRDPVTLPLLEVGDSVKKRYQEQAARCTQSFLYQAMKLCNDCDLSYKASKNKRLLVELTLIQCAQLTQASDEPVGGLRPTKILKPIFNQQPSTAVKKQNNVATNIQKEETSSQTTSPAANSDNSAVDLHPESGIQQLLARASGPTKMKLTLKGGKTGGFSIREALSGNANKPEPEISKEQQAANAAAERLQKMNNPATEENIRFYWMEFLQSLPQEEAATRGRMELMHPVLVDAETFEIVVGNKQVERDMKMVKPRIEKHMREGIGNARLCMRIRVASEKEARKYMSSHERFEAMCERNPALLKLKNELGMRVI